MTVIYALNFSPLTSLIGSKWGWPLKDRLSMQDRRHGYYISCTLKRRQLSSLVRTIVLNTGSARYQCLSSEMIASCLYTIGNIQRLLTWTGMQCPHMSVVRDAPRRIMVATSTVSREASFEACIGVDYKVSYGAFFLHFVSYLEAAGNVSSGLLIFISNVHITTHPQMCSYCTGPLKLINQKRA